MKTLCYIINLVLCLGALLITDVICSPFTCDYINDAKDSCTINGYTTNKSAPGDFESNIFVPYANSINFLKFANSTVNRVPNGIFKRLPNLEKLDLSDSEVEIISGSSFMLSGKLTVLKLANNLIPELADSLFNDAVNLQHIDLSHNRIAKISPTVFKNLNKLIKIDLSHNEITIESSSIFPVHLVYLNLDFNQIYRFEIDESSNIEEITLNNNTLRLLSIENMYLKVLHADHNRLTSDGLVCNKCNLQSLSVKSNYLTNLNVIKTMSNLLYLDLSNNLEITKNARIDSKMFANMTNLNKFVLKNVNLTPLDFVLFTNLHALETLDISWNQIKYLDLNLIPRLQNLKHLKLSNNNISILTMADIDYKFPKLNTINLSNNNWLCTDLKPILATFDKLKINFEITSEITVDHENIRGIRCTNKIKHKIKRDVPTSDSTPSDSKQTNCFGSNDMKLYMMAAAQVIEVIIMFIVIVLIYKKCKSRNDRYNNYNFSTIYCSPSKDEHVYEQITKI